MSKRTKAHYIHRLSYSAQEKLAGTFVLLAVGVLVWMLITSQKTQNLFEDEITLYATMTSIQAVNKDTNVIISGLNIGTVTDVNIDDSNQIIITMSILQKYQKLIRTDSVAELLNFKFALLGKSVIEISVGSPHLPIIEDGSTISIKESINLVQMVAKFEPVLNALQDSIKKMNVILQAIDAEKISANIENLAALSQDLAAITNHIKQGKGLAGSALYSDKMQGDVTDTTANLAAITSQIRQGEGMAGSAVFSDEMQDDVMATTANLQQITEQSKQLMKKMDRLLDSIQKQVDDMPELTDKVKPLLDEADKTLKASQRIWPLSSSMPEDNKQTLTAPEATE